MSSCTASRAAASTSGAGVQTYYLNDGLGSTTDLTDGGGDPTAGYSYDVFGATRSVTGSASTAFLFTGEQRDDDTSFYYLRARYYDPETGRFLSRDPFSGSVGAPQSQNLYAYAENNPINLIDPEGKKAVDPNADSPKEAAGNPSLGVPCIFKPTAKPILDACSGRETGVGPGPIIFLWAVAAYNELSDVKPSDLWNFFAKKSGKDNPAQHKKLSNSEAKRVEEYLGGKGGTS